jgi:branched-chain amino acid transport system permease protein
MQFLVTGLSMGSIYALVALGFVLIYKSTSILNLAQGEFMMVGAYICLSMTLDFGLNFFASFIITMFFSVILGLAVERLVLRPLIGEPIISIIMVTLGLTYILRGLVIMLWGNDIRQFNIFPEQPIDLWGVKVTYLYLWSMGISMVLLTFFAVFFKYSRTGVFMRAGIPAPAYLCGPLQTTRRLPRVWESRLNASLPSAGALLRWYRPSAAF